MCVITTLSTIGAGIATAASATASAASAVGSAVAGGLATVGSTIASGAATVGSTIASGATTIGSSIAELGATTAIGESGGIAEAVATGTAISPEAAVSTGAMKTTDAIVSNEVAALMTTGSLPSAETTLAGAGAVGGQVSSPSTFLGLTASGWKTAAGIAGAAGIVGAGSMTGVMQYKSTLDAANAQADAQERQAEQESISAEQSRLAAALSMQNAANAKLRAGLEMEAGEMEATDKARIARQERGSGLAQIAGNGVMIEGRKESVSTMYEADQKAELAYDQAKIMQNAEMRAWGYLSEANVHQMEALGNQYAAYGHDVAAASLLSSADSTRSSGRKSALYGGIMQGINTGISAASLLI